MLLGNFKIIFLTPLNKINDNIHGSIGCFDMSTSTWFVYYNNITIKKDESTNLLLKNF